jgi:hypothetical protein
MNEQNLITSLSRISTLLMQHFSDLIQLEHYYKLGYVSFENIMVHESFQSGTYTYY